MTVAVSGSGEPPGEGVECSLAGSAVTDADGNYTISGLCAPSTYTITLSSEGEFIDDPDLFCDGGLSASTTKDEQTVDKDFGLSRIYDGWVQVVGGGNVAAAGVLNNFIPPAQACFGSCAPVFVLDGASGDPGVVTYGTSYDLGNGAVSSKQWLVKSQYQGKRYGFEFWRTHVDVSAAAVSDWTGVELLDAAKPTQAPSHELVYWATGNMNIANGTWQIASGEKIVVLIKGNLTIKNRINVAPGGFLAMIASGDISIDPSVDSEDGQPAVEGVYIADGRFSTGGGDPAGDKKLVIAGTFVGWQGMALNRDFKSDRNNSEPAEAVIYRPDLITSAPSFMKRPTYVWEEVAP